LLIWKPNVAARICSCFAATFSRSKLDREDRMTGRRYFWLMEIRSRRRVSRLIRIRLEEARLRLNGHLPANG